MKKTIGLALFVVILLSACTEKKSPLVGIWKLQEIDINGSTLDFEDLGMPYLEFNHKGGYLLSMSGVDEKGTWSTKRTEDSLKHLPAVIIVKIWFIMKVIHQ